jgi:glucose/arabinose dehydrogenase
MRVAVALALCFALAGSAAGGNESKLALEPVASGLTDPVHVAAAPGEPGRLYVVERTGRIRVVERGRTRTFLDIGRLVARRGLRGLYSVAFDPRYRSNLRVRGDRSLVRREALTVPAGLYSFGEDGRGELYAASMEGTVSRIVSQ